MLEPACAHAIQQPRDPAREQLKEKRDGARAAQIALVLSEDEQKLTDDQRTKRDELERKLDALKVKRADMKEEAYYTEVESLLRELAAVYGE